ncbi:MAG: Mur ligase domain-containing protein, partial [Peptococcaceae bacterium]|nr:Mur ligase domain-containing protein [Peptococcaceae bacterium]
MLFSELLKEIDVVDAGGDLQVELRGIAYDSRQVSDGSLFVAIKGFVTDGHYFLGQAIQQGAVAVIIDRQVDLPDGVAWVLVADSRLALALLSAWFYNNPSQKIQMIGITGTNGKTTTTNLIATICEAAG